MEKERSGKNCKSCAKKLFYNGVEHKSLKKLFDYLGTKPSIYVSYRKSTGKEIRTNKDIDDFVHYFSERKNNRHVGNTSFGVEGKKYSSIKDFVENATPYKITQYNGFKQKTGISINSTKTAKQFLEYMNNKYSKLPLRKNPIEYNNKKYYYVKHLLQAVGSNEYEYSEFKRKTGVIISDRNSFQKYLDYKERI